MTVYPLALYRGDSYHWQFRLWSDVKRTVPFPLDGVTAAAEIRTASGAEPIATLPTTISQNNVDVTLSAEASRDLPAVASWDLQLTTGAGAVQTIVAGAVRVQGDITESSPTPP